jgi:hypothetical protein
MSDLIDVYADRPVKDFALTRIIVDAADDPSNDAFAFPAMERRIDGRTRRQIGEIRLGEGPTPPIPIDPAKYLLFSDLLHLDDSLPARKNTTFSLQSKNCPGSRTRCCPLPFHCSAAGRKHP